MESIECAYLAFVGYLMSAWFISDHAAARMQPRGWWVIAAERLTIGTIVAAVFAAVLFAGNRALIRRLWPNNYQFAIVTAAVGFFAVFAAVFAGALYFAIEKPFMCTKRKRTMAESGLTSRAQLRFYFNSREEDRLDAHIESLDGEFTGWLERPIEVAQNHKILRILEKRHGEIEERW